MEDDGYEREVFWIKERETGFIFKKENTVIVLKETNAEIFTEAKDKYIDISENENKRLKEENRLLMDSWWINNDYMYGDPVYMNSL